MFLKIKLKIILTYYILLYSFLNILQAVLLYARNGQTDDRGRFQKRFPFVRIYYYTFIAAPIKNPGDRCRQ